MVDAPQTDGSISQIMGDLVTLNGNATRKDTSYVASTPEVHEMITAIKDENKKWPGLWYELLQGALDYNDWEKGSPRILVYKTGDATQLLLSDFIQQYQAGEVTSDMIRRTEVRNFIGKQGLKPSNIALTAHDQVEGARKLGNWGRGLSIASTAACNLGGSIDYLSRTEELGTWFGKGSMMADEHDPSAHPSFSLMYQKTQALQTDETVIGINQPGKELLDSLVTLPDNFLPTRPGYRFNRLEEVGNPDYSPNALTVFSKADRVVDSTDASLPKKAKDNIWGWYNTEPTEETEPTRVEVLPFTQNDTEAQEVYVDGLKVQVRGEPFAVPWSFWGFGKALWRYDARRSNDSTKLDGNPINLVAETLNLCKNPEVFRRVLSANIGGKQTQEGKIDGALFVGMTAEAVAALASSWEQVKADFGYEGEVLVTSNKVYSEPSPRKDGETYKPVIFLNSAGLTAVLRFGVPNLRTVEGVLEDERRLQQAQLEEERKKRGIAEEAARTDERIKVAKSQNPEHSLFVARQYLLHELAYNEAIIVSHDEEGAVVMEYEPLDLDRMPGNANSDLGELGNFFRPFVANVGSFAELEVRVVTEEGGVYFTFDNRGEDASNNVTIDVQKGKLTEAGKKKIQIRLSPKAGAPEIVGKVNKGQYVAFCNELVAEARALLGPDKRVSYDQYQRSVFAKDFPPSLRRMQAREQQILLLQQEQALLMKTKRIRDLENRRRELLGLPLISEPDEESRDRKQLEGEIEKIKEEEERRRQAILQEVLEEVVVGYSEETEDSRDISTPGPDTALGVMRRGGVRNREDELAAEDPQRRLLEGGLKRFFTPDMTIHSGADLGLNGYLVSHINPEHSIVRQEDYVPMSLPRGEIKGGAHLEYNKPLVAKRHALLCPPGCEPAGFFHPDFKGKIEFAELAGKNMYTFSCTEEIPAGLRFYFKRSDRIDVSEPDEKERASILILDKLNPEWRDLVDLVNTDSLTNKEKVDIVLRAWTKSFTYSGTQDVFDRYKGLVDGAFATEIVNQAEGNCGYAGRAFGALCKAVGVPAREVGAYLSNSQGKYNVHSNYHMINQVWIDNRWVLIEPQSNYMTKGYEIEKPPHAVAPAVNDALDKIPKKKFQPIRRYGNARSQVASLTSNVREQMSSMQKKNKWKYSLPAAGLGTAITLGILNKLPTSWAAWIFDITSRAPAVPTSVPENPTVIPYGSTPVPAPTAADPAILSNVPSRLPSIDIDQQVASFHRGVEIIQQGVETNRTELIIAGSLLGLVGGIGIGGRKLYQYAYERGKRKSDEEIKKIRAELEEIGRDLEKEKES